MDVTVNALNLDNLAQSFSEFRSVSFELLKLAEKYEYTVADDILKDHILSRYGIDIETVEFVDFKAKIIELAVAAGVELDLKIWNMGNCSALETALGDSLQKADAENSNIRWL